jgi:hypothetical protein
MATESAAFPFRRFWLAIWLVAALRASLTTIMAYWLNFTIQPLPFGTRVVFCTSLTIQTIVFAAFL